MGKTIDKTHVNNTRTVIKVNRLLQAKSQKDLCEGICTPSHLSKIEKGETHASEEMLKMLYKALGLCTDLDTSEGFLKEGYKDITIFNDSFMFNEFDVTNKRFANLEDNESSFMSSPFILDYLIAKLSFNSAQNRKVYTEVKGLLSTITDHMTGDQKYHYYLCLGVDALKMIKDLKRAKQYFELAGTYAYTGQLNYWLGYMYLSDRRPVEAMKHIQKASIKSFEEASIVGIISTFELMGLTYYSASEYETGIEQYLKALDYTRLAVHSPYEANIKNQIAWGYMRLNDYDNAMSYIVQDRYNSDITVNASVTKFLIAYYLKSPVMMDALKSEFSFRNRSLHRMIFSVLEKEQYFDKFGKWLAFEDEVDSLFEFAQFTHFELEKAFCEIACTYYIDNGDYERAYHYLKQVSSRVCLNNNCLSF